MVLVFNLMPFNVNCLIPPCKVSNGKIYQRLTCMTKKKNNIKKTSGVPIVVRCYSLLLSLKLVWDSTTKPSKCVNRGRVVRARQSGRNGIKAHSFFIELK